MRGTVKSIFSEKQFGFIRGSDGVDYFFHATELVAPDLIDTLVRGAAVEFQPNPQSPKGPRASGVRALALHETATRPDPTWQTQ